MLKELKIDPEFEKVIPPLTKDEYHQLEENILDDGRIMMPIAVWGDIIVDGHNRYRIAREYGDIPFSTTQLDFDNRYEAIAWICKNQLGRRNLSDEQKAYLLGKRYSAEKQIAMLRDENGRFAPGGQNDHPEEKLKTSERIAKEIGKSEKHVRRAEQYAQALDLADSVCPGIKKDILSGFINTTNKDVIALLKADKEDLPDMIDELRGIKKKEDVKERHALCESIEKSGLLSPIIVRPRDEGGYEILSGHRRFRAYQRLGLTEIPSTVCDMTDEEAVVAMVDANLHRDHILPSEKAFAYKMKLDAIKRQGERTDLTSDQLGQRLTSVEKIAAESDESKTQIQRYISLTRLIPELLQMVDEGRIALTPAVELSKLHWQTQKLIYEICDMDDLTPSYSQTVRMRKLADEGALGEDAIREIISEEKANQRERIVIYMDDIKQYYPRNMLPKDIVADIKNLLHKRRLEQLRRKENRDAR